MCTDSAEMQLKKYAFSKSVPQLSPASCVTLGTRLNPSVPPILFYKVRVIIVLASWDCYEDHANYAYLALSTLFCLTLEILSALYPGGGGTLPILLSMWEWFHNATVQRFLKEKLI